MIESIVKESKTICIDCKQEIPIGTKIGVSLGRPHHLGICPEIKASTNEISLDLIKG